MFPGRRCVFGVPIPGKCIVYGMCIFDDEEYQRWIYRIDPKRVNEYGQVMDEGERKKD